MDMSNIGGSVGKRWKGYIPLGTAVILWSWIGVLGKFIYSYGVDPLTAVTFRVFFAWGFLALSLLCRPVSLNIPRRKIPGLGAYGLVAIVLNYLGYFYALQYLPVAAAVILIYTNPALVLLLSWPVLGERPRKGELFALLVTFAGVFLVAQGYTSEKLVLNWKGVTFALVTSASIAVYNLAGKRYVGELDPWVVMFYGLLFGGGTLAAWWGARGCDTLAYPLGAWALLALLGLFPTLLGYGCYLGALRYLRVVHAALIATFEPFLASLWAALLLDERLEPLQILGGILVLGAVTALQLRSARHLRSG